MKDHIGSVSVALLQSSNAGPSSYGMKHHSPPAPHGSARGQTGQTILVIEDDATIRDMIAETLDDSGWRILTAPDGRAGLALLNTTPPIDLLVTDIRLPGMNGRQVAAAAQALHPDIKILFISGLAAPDDGPDLPPNAVIMAKPFTLQNLATRINALLNS